MTEASHGPPVGQADGGVQGGGRHVRQQEAHLHMEWCTVLLLVLLLPHLVLQPLPHLLLQLLPTCSS